MILFQPWERSSRLCVAEVCLRPLPLRYRSAVHTHRGFEILNFGVCIVSVTLFGGSPPSSSPPLDLSPWTTREFSCKNHRQPCGNFDFDRGAPHNNFGFALSTSECSFSGGWTLFQNVYLQGTGVGREIEMHNDIVNARALSIESDSYAKPIVGAILKLTERTVKELQSMSGLWRALAQAYGMSIHKLQAHRMKMWCLSTKSRKYVCFDVRLFFSSTRMHANAMHFFLTSVTCGIVLGTRCFHMFGKGYHRFLFHGTNLSIDYYWNQLAVKKL